MAETNATILSKIWLSATNDFQQRIPNPTQAGIDATVSALFDPMNRNYFNQFIDVLIMRIGETYVHQQTWRNPLSVFKKSRLMYGSTLQEIIPKWIRAHSYVDDAEDVFKMSRPDVAQWFHSQNRRDRYDITINRDELRTAFTEEGGLNRLVAAILEVPMNSDEYDEYQIMKQLFAIYEAKWGFFKVQVSAPTNTSTAQALLKLFRVYRRKLTYPTTIYNSGQIDDVPVFARPDELVLFITPEVEASIDVDALAVLFNMDKADIKQRVIVLDEFPIAGTQAILTTDDFFMCKDTEYETTSIYNPKTLGQNYFLHHWGIYSISPFVPAIMFTTASGTSIPTVTQTLSSISLSLSDNQPKAGDLVNTTVTLSGTLAEGGDSYSGDAVVLAPSSCKYDVEVTRTQTGRAGVYNVALSGTWVATDTINIAGVVVTTGSTSASTIAGTIRTAFANNPLYTPSGSGATVTLTEKATHYGVGAPNVSTDSTAGMLTVSTTTEAIPETAPVNDNRTYVDYDGVLHVGENLETNDTITVKATSTYINPSGSTSAMTATAGAVVS